MGQFPPDGDWPCTTALHYTTLEHTLVHYTTLRKVTHIYIHFFEIGGGANQWRVCYQWGQPPLFSSPDLPSESPQITLADVSKVKAL